MERGLHRVELAVGGHALDGGDGAAVGLDREHRAGLHGQAVEQDGAHAAAGRVAAHVGATEAEDLPDVVDEQHAGLDLGGARRAVGRASLESCF